jgi:hypothetical protein
MKRVIAATALCLSILAVSPNPVAASTCVDSGPATVCLVGQTGPGGGTIFYDAGSLQWWGRYLELSPNSVKIFWAQESRELLSIYSDGTDGLTVAQQQLRSKAIGMGKLNTAAIINSAGKISAAGATQIPGSDWYLPSKDELNALYDWSARNNKAAGVQPRWSSSEAGNGFAWYQLFQDGTQFTDANGIIPKLMSNKLFTKTPKHVGSDFVPTALEATSIRAFPASTGVPPAMFIAPNDPTVNPGCIPGGTCKVGDWGPGGGIVFYDAGVDKYWGRYLEVAPATCEGTNMPFKVGSNVPYSGQDEARRAAKAVGMGKINTRVLTTAFRAGTYAAKFAGDSTCGGKDDWFLPSKDELDLVYNNIAQNRPTFTIANPGQKTPLGGFDKGYYWTSSDYNGATAWAQYFQDGQQFDRVQTLRANGKAPSRPFSVRPIRAFGSVEVKSCAQGGFCKTGDVGPGGGTVFYVAPDFLMLNSGWRYMEFAPDVIKGPFCRQSVSSAVTNARIGFGQLNTVNLLKLCSVGGVRNVHNYVSSNGTSDWFVPSKDELDSLYLSNLSKDYRAVYFSSTVLISVLFVKDMDDGYSFRLPPDDHRSNLRPVRMIK